MLFIKYRIEPIVEGIELFTRRRTKAFAFRF